MEHDDTDDPARATPAGPVAAGKRQLGRNLPVAIASGVFLAGVFIGTLFANTLAFLVFWAVLVTIGLVELDRAFRLRGVRPALPVVVGAGLVIVFGAYTHGAAAQSFGLALLVIGAMAWTLLDVGRGEVVASIAASCLMGLWVPFLASFAAPLLERPQGEWYMLAAVALTVSGDIGAYAFGYRFGRRKLAPSISPAKSWEGLLGGLLTVVVVAALIIARFGDFTLPLALVFGVACFLAGTFGDLAESMVKRDLRVKDLGGIVPGHGGIMDRADAVLFALPVAHAVLSAFGR